MAELLETSDECVEFHVVQGDVGIERRVGEDAMPCATSARDFELFFEGQIAKDIEPNVLGYIRHGLSHRDRDHDIHIHRS